MPTTLVLTYNAYVTITVPNDLAKKLQNDELIWNNKYGNLYYQDENGKEQCIQGGESDADYKRAVDFSWEEPEESDDEESDDEPEESDDETYEDKKAEILGNINKIKNTPEGQAALKKVVLELEEEDGVSS